MNHIQAINGCFWNAWIAYIILLTIPVIVASVEKRFSKLKSIKSYLQLTMLQERLNGLAMLSIENEMVKEIDYSSIISDFVAKNPRRTVFK